MQFEIADGNSFRKRVLCLSKRAVAQSYCILAKNFTATWDGCDEDSNMYSFICKEGGLVTQRHNEIYLFRELANLAWSCTQKEPVWELKTKPALWADL